MISVPGFYKHTKSLLAEVKANQEDIRLQSDQRKQYIFIYDQLTILYVRMIMPSQVTVMACNLIKNTTTPAKQDILTVPIAPLAHGMSSEEGSLLT